MAEVALTVGGGVLSALLQVLFDKLSSPLMLHAGHLFKAEEKLKNIKWTLVKIHSMVAHAEMLGAGDPGLTLWLRELKDVAWDAENVLDDFATQKEYQYTINTKISEIQKRLSRIANERRDLGFSDPSHYLHPRLGDWRATSSLPTEKFVFGRDSEIERVVELLRTPHDSEPRCHLGAFSVLPIVGMGGLGKTTLARVVYNDPRVEHHFHLRVWICVSNDFSVRRITEEFIGGVSHERRRGGGIASLDKIQNDLRRKLSKKRFLLVLDDVWSENRQEWEKLCAPFKFGEGGSKILITTRSSRLANIFGAADPLFLGPLQESDSWDLFKSCAFTKNNSSEHPRIEEIGRKISRRLKGVPLAAKTVGGLLCSNTDEGVWTAILDSQLWKLPQFENDIMPVLRLSYQQMPSQLKMCFSFCSLFPKGSKFDRNRLVLLWIAQGFVQPQGKRRIEEIGGEYFDDLVSRSFFQNSDDGFFLMHDLIHELAQYIAIDESVIIDDSTQKIPEKVLHSSLHFDSSFEFNSLYKLTSLRTLVHLEKKAGYELNVPKVVFKDFSIPKELFERLKYVRVLDLRYSHIVDLPESIGLLKHLRYLDLSYSKISSLRKEFGDLCNLQTLHLENCDKLLLLPECMNKLTNLRSCRGKDHLLSKLKGIGNLKSLQELNKFELSGELGRKIGELKDLNELRGRLHISHLEKVLNGDEANEAGLINKQCLRVLEVEWGTGRREDGSDQEVLESLKPHSDLKLLKIRCNYGVNFPSWLADQSLTNLEDVSLVRCQRWTVLPPLKQLVSLRRLEIGGMTRMDDLPAEFWSDNGFQSLQELRIFDMPRWKSLGPDFPSLYTFDISDCPQISVLPALPSTLKELKISEVGLTALPRVCDCTGISSSSASLDSLIISGCHKLQSLKEGLLQDCHLSLRILEISNCENLESLPMGGFSRLVSLTSLIIQNCPNLASLSEDSSLSSSLQTLKFLHYTNFVTSHGSDPLFNGFHNLTCLSTLCISTSPHLKSLSGEILVHLKSLEKLIITDCKELQILGIQSLLSLKNLVVTSCPKLTSLTDMPPIPIPLRSITIRDCASFFILSKNLIVPSLLEELTIEKCPKMKSMRGKPSSLQILETFSASI